MPDNKHYSRAPIVEAVIDLRCEFAKPLSLEDIERVPDVLSAEYPIREDAVEFKAQLSPRSGMTGEQRKTGFRLVSRDGRKIAAMGIEGFTFSWLAPYDRWESLRDEALRIWRIYSSSVQPVRVNRTGVRFINRLDLPNPGGSGIELDDYLRTTPRIAPDLPQSLQSFFLRFQLLLAGTPPVNLTIIETSAAPAGPSLVSVILDIDVFIQQQQATGEAAWALIEELRHHKNFAFESCITDMTRGLIL